jgi:Zn-dependent protease with chaperone function
MMIAARFLNIQAAQTFKGCSKKFANVQSSVSESRAANRTSHSTNHQSAEAMMKLKNRKWLLGLGVITVSQFPTATPAQAQLLGLSEEEEIRAGQQVARQAEQQYGGVMPANHQYSRRVRTIGAQFARLSSRKNIPYTYKVLNDNKTLNAFAAPGGPVYVTRKLVETTANDAELAYVLGHETGHIDRKHIVKQVEKEQKAGLIAGVLGAILGRSGNSDTIGTIANIGWTVVSRGYSRDDENDADSVGVRWMAKLGYDPRASVSMLGKLGGSGGGGISKYLSTHPDPKNRQARMQALINSEKLIDVARAAGGPRLTSNISTGYTPTSYPGETANNGYPPSGGSTYYPPTGNNDYPPSYYPPTDGTPGYSDNGEVSLGAPLRVWPTNNVVIAPVRGFAQWAGARITNDGRRTIVSRGDTRIELSVNSTVASLNGRTVTMSAPATMVNDTLYAPLGHLAAAVKARAELDQTTGLVRLTLDGRSAGFIRLPNR